MHDSERDDFWDIEKLVPKRERKRAGVRFDVSGVEISDGTPERTEKSTAELRLSGAEVMADTAPRETLLYEYVPDSAFVSRVRIYSHESRIRYYEDFERTMHKYLRLTVKSAERVSYFSYVPQYSQLSGGRMAWYLYWRSGCRRREYMQTDYAYVLLYVFELLNFHNPRHPDRIADELCSLWCAYRAEYPQLDRCMPDWVCDYCLIHRLPFPYEAVGGFMDELLPHVAMREFFLGARDHGQDSYARAVVMAASGYNYKKSKHYTDAHRALFDTHIASAAAYGVGKNSDKFRNAIESKARSTARRDAYAGALCTSSARRVISIEYTPLYRSGEMRVEATLAVKYAENKLRSVIGVRSRLSVTGLAAAVRDAIDEYFTERFPEHFDRLGRTAEERELSREYMAFYESPSSGLELGRAADIEAESWATAELMGEAFDEEDAQTREPAEDCDGDPAQNKEEGVEEYFPSPFGGTDDGWIPETCAALDALCVGVLALLAKKRPDEAKSLAAENGAFLSDVCAKINETAQDVMGDVLIECVSDEYYILDDYESEVKQWLKI